MRPETERSYRERILQVLLHIQEHLDDDLTLPELAKVAYFSEYHFHRIFKGLVGESLKGHIRRLRLERAAFRLMHTDQPITPMAFDAGYESHEAFSRAFRALFEVAPREFRQRHRLAWHVPAPAGVHYAPEGETVAFTPPAGAAVPEPISVERHDRRHAVFMRHVGPYLESLPTWQRLIGWASDRGLDHRGMMTGICYDDPAVTAPDRLRYDACLLVDEPVAPEGEVGARDLFGGRFALFRHEGRYERLAGLYEAWLGRWLPQSRYDARDTPCVEVYRASPLDTPDPDAYVTDVYVPVGRRRGSLIS